MMKTIKDMPEHSRILDIPREIDAERALVEVYRKLVDVLEEDSGQANRDLERGRKCQSITGKTMARKRSAEGKIENRNALGSRRKGAMFPVAPARAGLPSGYAGILRDLKQRIQQERLRTVMAANSAMVILYWDIGRTILARQSEEGWGARVIDRLSTDLREAFPDMYGLSPRNLIYMRAFAAAWPDRAIVQQLAAQIPWFHNCTENQSDSPTRRGTGQGFHCAPSRPVSFNDQAYGRKQSGPWKNGASRVAESATKVEHGTFMA